MIVSCFYSLDATSQHCMSLLGHGRLLLEIVLLPKQSIMILCGRYASGEHELAKVREKSKSMSALN